jgi:hypothetical protein
MATIPYDQSNQRVHARVRARELLGVASTRTLALAESQASTWALAESLTLNHGFVDGNKRTAMYAMAAWREREGYVIDAAARRAARPGSFDCLA